MTARTVRGTVEFPVGSGSPCVGARVAAQLYTGTSGDIAYGTANDIAIGSTAVLSDNDGAWSLDLEPNDNITPTGTVWQITTTPPDRQASTYYIEVPDTAGPHDVTDLLTDQPGALPSGPLTAHMALKAAHDSTVVDVADLDASAGDATTDVSQAYRDAYAAVAATRYTTALSSGGFPRKTIRIPPGTHRVTSSEAFMRDLGIGRTAGFVVKGAGRGVSVIDFQPATADACLFRNPDDWLLATFEDISFFCSGDNAATATWMETDSDGGAQNYAFHRCYWGGTWRRGLNLTGSNVNSEMSWLHCNINGSWADAFLHVGDTDTSDQFLNYNFFATQFEVSGGSFIRMHKGGNVNVWGGSLIHTADLATATPMIELFGTSHAYGVCRLLLSGVRAEHRTPESSLIYCEWPNGAVSFVSLDTTSGSPGEGNADAVTAEFAFGNTHGPAVEWTNCMLAGRHKYTSTVNGWDGSHRVHYQSCELSTQDTAHDFIVAENTGNAGGIPQIRFDNCRSQAAEEGQPFDCAVNWEQQWKGQPTRRYQSLKLASGGSPTSSLSTDVVLPLNSVITKVWAVKTAGGTATGTTWSYTLTDSDDATIATLSAGGTVWNTAWSKAVDDLYVMCGTTNKRTLTLTAANITESSALLHIVIEYLA